MGLFLFLGVSMSVGILEIHGGFANYCIAEQYLSDVMQDTATFKRNSPLDNDIIILHYVIHGNCIQKFFRMRKFNRAIEFLNEKNITINMF